MMNAGKSRPTVTRVTAAAGAPAYAPGIARNPWYILADRLSDEALRGLFFCRKSLVPPSSSWPLGASAISLQRDEGRDVVVAPEALRVVGREPDAGAEIVLEYIDRP